MPRVSFVERPQGFIGRSPITTSTIYFFVLLPSAPPPTLNADGVSWLSRQAGATVHPMCKRTPHAASGSHSQDKASWTPPLRPPTTANGNATDRGFQFLHAQSSAPLRVTPPKRASQGRCRRPAPTQHFGSFLPRRCAATSPSDDARDSPGTLPPP